MAIRYIATISGLIRWEDGDMRTIPVKGWERIDFSNPLAISIECISEDDVVVIIAPLLSSEIGAEMRGK